MGRVKVVLLSYRRPELTLASIERVLQWPNLDSLLVSVDGIRADAPDKEHVWWAETRSVAERFASLSEKVHINFRSENTGLTNHVVQALSVAFSTHDSAILLEEDIEVGSKGLDFLASAVDNADKPQGASAFTRSVHLGSVPTKNRRTFFPELWGMSLNYEFFKHFENMWTHKQLDRELITRSMRSSFPRLRARRLDIHVDWWMTLFESALRNHTHQDALFAATALELGTPWIASWESLSRDGAWGDERSLHPRGPGDDATFNHRPALSGSFCSECERKHGRLMLSSLPRRTYERLYRSFKRL